MEWQACLGRIARTAEAMQNDTRRFYTAPNWQPAESINVINAPPLTLHVPSPVHLVRELTEAGAPQKIAEALSMKYHILSKDLADYQSNTSYAEALNKLRCCPSLGHTDFISSFQDVHRQTYRRYLLKWEGEILNFVKENFAPDSVTDRSKPNSFDQAFVPFLERCFSKNQRPSREDKELLAEKTGMSYRQIHVWFQNRRSRTKKTLEKSDSQSEGLSSCSRATSVTLVEQGSLSKVDAPIYAFPAMYPPEIEEDPFPCRFGDFSSFPKPCWLRSPYTKPETTSQPPDVSALISAFGKLHLHDVSESRSRRKVRSTTSMPKAMTGFYYEAIRPTVVRPLRAPLLSFVRSGMTRIPPASPSPFQESDQGKRNERSIQKIRRKTKSRKPRQCSAVEQIRNAVEPAHQSVPPTQTVNEIPPVQSTAPSKFEATRGKASCATSATRKGRRAHAEPEVTVETPRENEETSSSHPSPTASIDSLPPLSCSITSSSSSTCSPSPTSNFATLPNGGFMSSIFDEYQSNSSSLTLSPSLTTPLDDYPPPPAAFTSEGFSLDLPKGPLDYSFGFDLSAYPSYVDPFDSLSQGLGTFPDFFLPSSFELPCLAP